MITLDGDEKEFLGSDLSRQEEMLSQQPVSQKKTIQEELEEVFALEYPKMEEQKTASQSIGLNVPRLDLDNIQREVEKDAKPEKDEFQM